MRTNNTLISSVWNILFPFLLYYITYHAAYIILAFCWNVIIGKADAAWQSFLMENANTVSGVLGGLCMLLGILPLFSMLKLELAERAIERKKNRTLPVLSAVFLAVCASVGLNVFFSLTGLTSASDTFREVAKSQFGTLFAAGVILYGVVSPLAEEVVFRGIIYNRLRRSYSIPLAVIVSGVLFGLYHGNLVQGVYGSCMGILIAYVYERSGSFLMPVLVHGVANLSVYVIAGIPFWREKVFTVAGCIILLGLVLLNVVIVEVRRKKVK